MNGSPSKEQWGTRIGVILAVAGSAVGLGNFLRFPGQAAQNGGGAFMIPYFISFLLLGIPICWAEWSMGRLGGVRGYNSTPGIFGAVSRKKGWTYAGALGLLIPIVIYMYYVVIESWCLQYAWSFLTGSIDLGTDPAGYVDGSKGFFGEITGAGANGAVFSGGLHLSLLFWAITFAINFYLIFRGLSKGIEKFCIWAMPLMSVCAFVVLVRVLTLGTPNPAFPTQNVIGGLGFMWNPKPIGGEGTWLTALASPQTWLAAAGQIFFSLSVGFGIIVNYSSYLKRDDDIALSGLTAASTNEFFEVCLGGLITIPAAFVFLGQMGIQDSLGTFSIGFNTLPVVFQYMPFGRLFGFLWFFMLFLAAITSSLSMLQPAIAFLEESLGIGRKASVSLLGLVTVMGSLFVIYFSEGLMALDTLDFWAGTFLIFVLATIEVILFSWVLGAERGWQEAMRGSHIRIPRLFIFVIRWVTPAYLLIIFAAWLYKELVPRMKVIGEGGVPFFSLLLIGAMLVFLVVLINLALRRWDFSTIRDDETESAP